jgi:hypothetical protein
MIDQMCSGNEQQVSGATRIFVSDDQVMLTGQQCEPVQARPAERAGCVATHSALHGYFSGRRYAAWQVTCYHPPTSPCSEALPHRHPSTAQTLAFNIAGPWPLDPYRCTRAVTRQFAARQLA